MRAADFVGVLWQTDAEAAYVVPLVVRGGGNHRSDVRYDEPLLPTKGALRAGALSAVRSALTVTGRVSDETVAKLDAALRREVRARQFENRFPAETMPRQERAVRM